MAIGILSHYIHEIALDTILRERKIRPSTAVRNPKDARYDDGVYLTDIEPGALGLLHLSRRLLGHPFGGHRLTQVFAISTDGRDIQEGRVYVFVALCTIPLELEGRVIGFGSSLSSMNR